MSAGTVHVVPTGTANLASIRAAFARLGSRAVETTDPRVLRIADRVVLPGVGSFAAGCEALERLALRDVLSERIAAGRPTLAVCLGMQLLGESSEEAPGASGLGACSARAERFPNDVRVPQLGWNRIEPDAASRFVTPGFAYFANSYRVAEPPDGWAVAWADHGGAFVAALERGSVLACQFHPELSGAWGADLLRRWLEGGASC